MNAYTALLMTLIVSFLLALVAGEILTSAIANAAHSAVNGTACAMRLEP